jgi:tryptophan halogenase
MTQSAPLDIVIAGGGTAGWVAAATFARFVGNRATITLVESDEIGTVGVGEATIPQIHNLIIGLGLDQAEFVRATNATFKLGIEFAGWNGEGSNYIHSFGSTGRGVGLIPFRQLWLRGRALGVAREFGEYAFNIAAARLGRMAVNTATNTVPELAYAYHFDASLVAKMLRGYAGERGVRRIEGRIEDVERDGETGDVAALLLNGERRVPGTLFIDCTGFRSLLLGKTLGVPYLDWSNWLPCNSALAVPCESSDAFRPYTQAMARPAGWQWRIPLQHRTGNGHVYCNGFISDDEAASILLANLDGTPLADPRPIRFTSGRRETFWSHNCIALGLAAGFMEPLESTSIHLVQAGIARLLEMLPTRRFEPADIRRYNRLMTAEFESIRDFLILHFHATERTDTPYWRDLAAMPIPESLQERMHIYAETGRIFREADDLFTKTSWLAVMDGQGLRARSFDPLAAAMPIEEAQVRLARIAAVTQAAVQHMVPHGDYIARYCAAE